MYRRWRWWWSWLKWLAALWYYVSIRREEKITRLLITVWWRERHGLKQVGRVIENYTGANKMHLAVRIICTHERLKKDRKGVKTVCVCLLLMSSNSLISDVINIHLAEYVLHPFSIKVIRPSSYGTNQHAACNLINPPNQRHADNSVQSISRHLLCLALKKTLDWINTHKN